MEKVLEILNKLPSDKCRHAFYGLVIYIVVYFIVYIFLKSHTAALFSFVTVLVVALLKEIYDAGKINHTASIWDFLFTILFAFAVTMLLITK